MYSEELSNPMDTYEIIGEIGKGGGGTVYKAFHKRLKKDVVIKKIHSDISDENMRRAEVDILKNLHHPYLPQVFDYFIIDSAAYTVMDYVQGKSFGELIREGRSFTEKQLIKYATQMCEALEYLHSRQIPVIHGDIKPDNVMLTPDDNICLIDFNISGISENGKAVTYGCTVGYSAPEQFKEFNRLNSKNTTDSTTDATEILDNRNKKNAQDMEGIPIDKRSDVYSLGATLYSIYSGKVLNRASDNQLENKISEGFLFILNKALQNEPDSRYQDAGQMLRAITVLYENDTRFKKFLMRRRLVYVMLAVMFVAGAALILQGRNLYEKQVEDRYEDIMERMNSITEMTEEEHFNELFEEALILRPGSIEAYYRKAIYLYRIGKYEETIDFIEETLNEDNGLYGQDGIGDLYYILGNSYFEIESYENAANALATAIKYNETNAKYYVDYAMAEARLGRTDIAYEALEDAEKNNATNSELYLARGEIQLNEENYEEAEAELKQSIATAEDDYIRMRAYIMCAKAILGKGGSALNEAISLLEEGIEILPEEYQPMVLEQLASMYIKGYKDKNDESYALGALNSFKRLENLNRTTFATYDSMVNLYNQMGDYKNEGLLLLELENKYPDNYKIPMKQAFLEARLQSEKAVSDRNYSEFKKYYDNALEMYNTVKKNGWTDAEMQILESTYNELKEGKWLD